MTPVIISLLASLLGSKPENIFVIANDVEARHGKDINGECGWRIKYRDDSEFGHDKSLEIKPYGALPDQHRPLLLYAGDGVSDLSAASETEILFANECLDLVTYCEQKEIEFVPFTNWISILDSMRDIEKGIHKPKSVGQRIQDLKV
ncbi:unnamed protein product [Penicillium salamii]|nr:unnamed protein product [Penicillium salamii]CAG8241653.1 unnamed protein product [Penicillium salamii]CAG8402798.1 unnamed protein product [Penicillium salamii]